MIRALRTLACLSVVAFPAAAEMSADDAALIDCAAKALVFSEVVSDVIDRGGNLPQRLEDRTDRWALELLDAAQPLFAAGAGGNVEMSLAVDRANGVLDAARQAETMADWFRQAFLEVEACHVIHAVLQGQSQ